MHERMNKNSNYQMKTVEHATDPQSSKKFCNNWLGGKGVLSDASGSLCENDRDK